MRVTSSLAVLSAALSACGPATPQPDDDDTVDPDQLLLDDFADGTDRCLDWNDSPGWIRAEGGALVVQTAAADHDQPAWEGDQTYTFGALAAHCPRLDDEGRCLDPGPGWSDFSFEADVNVVRQLREPVEGGSNLSASWEVAWLFFRFADTRHYYYVLFLGHHALQPAEDYGGFEIGKYNCPDDCGVFSANSGKETLLQLPAGDIEDVGRRYLELDRWYRWRIEVSNSRPEDVDVVHIAAFLDGDLVGEIDDDGTPEPVFGGDGPTPPLLTGGVGLYGEDCEAWFDNVSVRRLPSEDG